MSTRHGLRLYDPGSEPAHERVLGEGARETNPKVKFTISFIGSWFDPPKADGIAFAMIDKGADVHVAEALFECRPRPGEGQASRSAT